MSDELIDAALRNLFVFLWLLSLLPSGIFAGGPNLGGASVEKVEIKLRAYRLQQFETAGKIYGSKSWKVLYEAVSINESALRKCMILEWRQLVGVVDMDAAFSGAIGAVLVIIPGDLNALTGSARQDFLALEHQLASLRTDLAVFFAPDCPELRSLLASVALTSGKAPTALQQLLNSIMADNYLISSASTATTSVANAKVYNVIAQLNAAERGRPYLFVVAHYDTYGVIPALATGADSNGSGVAALLELLSIFSQLYAHSHRTHFNLVFVLTAAGPFSYQGSRSFIEDFNERYSEETVSFAICLDGLAKGDHLYVHAAKAPGSGSNANKFIEILKDFGGTGGSNGPRRPAVELVTKKINLAAERLAWEHEIYNIRRIHAFTLSHFENHTDPERDTLLDGANSLDMSALEANTKTIVDALVTFVFGLNSKLCQSAMESQVECTVLNNVTNISRKRLAAWIKMFGSKPRPIVVPQQQLVANLHEVCKRYAHTAHISEVSVNDFVLYEIIDDTLAMNIVKPAIFELFLAAAICTYLFAIYYLALNAQPILEGSIAQIRKLI